MKHWKLPVLTALIVGLLLHLVIVMALPRIVMHQAIELIRADYL